MKHKQEFLFTKGGQPIYGNGRFKYSLDPQTFGNRQVSQIFFSDEGFAKCKELTGRKASEQLGVEVEWLPGPDAETTAI